MKELETKTHPEYGLCLVEKDVPIGYVALGVKHTYIDLFKSAPELFNLLQRIVADYSRSDEEAGGVSSMEYLIEEAKAVLERGS